MRFKYEILLYNIIVYLQFSAEFETIRKNTLTSFPQLFFPFYRIQLLRVIALCFEVHAPSGGPLALRLRFAYAFLQLLSVSLHFVSVALSSLLGVRKLAEPRLSKKRKIYNSKIENIKTLSYFVNLPLYLLLDQSWLFAIDKVSHYLQFSYQYYILYPLLTSRILLPIIK